MNVSQVGGKSLRVESVCNSVKTMFGREIYFRNVEKELICY